MPKGPQGQKRKAEMVGSAGPHLTDQLWDFGDIEKLIEDWEAKDEL